MYSNIMHRRIRRRALRELKQNLNELILQRVEDLTMRRARCIVYDWMACHQIELKFEVVFVDDKILEVNFDRKDLARSL
jgi:hypothetical protein